MAEKKRLPFGQLVREFVKPYRQLLPYLLTYRKRFVTGLVCGVVAGLLTGAIPLVIKLVGERVLPSGQSLNLSKSTVMQAMKNQDAGGPGIDGAIWLALLIPAVMIARGIFDYLNSYCLAWVSFRVLRDLRTNLFKSLLRQSLGFFHRAKSGKLISRVLSDARVAQTALTTVSGDIVKQPVAVISSVAALVVMDWRFSLTMLILFPACMIPVIIFGRKVRKAGKQEENEAGQMAVILQETFAGMRVVKSFAREDYQSEQFRASSDLQCRNSMRVRKAIEIVQPLIESIAAVGVALAIIYVHVFGINIFKFAALCFGILLIYPPIKALSRIPMMMQKCLTATTNIFDLMELEPAVKDAPGAAAPATCAGGLAFENVSFSYGSEGFALKDVRLDIPPHKQFALVGASGSGKSTMLSLILRFYDPASGTIRLDGRDLREIPQVWLREHIGTVTQETFLFHDTIYENIRYGRLNATREEVIEAAKTAYAHDFITAQPQGYDTVVGDKGCLLSGGQQQRLAIARALLKDAPILLLDEATSALDSESERMIQAALERLARGRTVIAIAHRLSTILKSDQIVVMDHGRISAVGTHAELLESSAIYRRLYELQFHHEEVVAVG